MKNILFIAAFALCAHGAHACDKATLKEIQDACVGLLGNTIERVSGSPETGPDGGLSYRCFVFDRWIHNDQMRLAGAVDTDACGAIKGVRLVRDKWTVEEFRQRVMGRRYYPYDLGRGRPWHSEQYRLDCTRYGSGKFKTNGQCE